jgi:GTP-binding protein YchF
MRLGIIGLPSCGKTTIFNALTGGDLATGVRGDRLQVHTAVSDVPDRRVDDLSALFKPRKTIYAKVTYADIGGLKAEAGRDGLPGQLLNQLSQMDGFVHVVRAFESELVPHPAGRVDPARDLAAMEAELLLNDMLTVERRLEKLREERQKGGGREKAVIDREVDLFERLSGILGKDQPLRQVSFSPEDERAMAIFGFLTRKPLLVVVNLAEGQPDPGLAAPGAGVQVLALQGEIEMEIAQLAPEEARAFLEEYGIAEAGRDRVLRASYDLLGLQSFFTVGDDEVRAWTVARGATALDAAGAIHTDLARGFIRAEVIHWKELLDLGGLAQARTAGKLRVEGRDYVVHDGEVVHIRFNA